MEPHRASNRRRLRESLTLAARELAVERGWNAVRMADVAGAVGVSRQTLYNEFDGKDALAEAVASREIEAFVDGVRASLSGQGDDLRGAVEDAVRFVLTEAAANPLVRTILTGAPGEADGLLPFLTTRSAPVIATASAVVRDRLSARPRRGDREAAEIAVDCLVRLVISHVLHPGGDPGRTATTLTDAFLRLLAPE